MVAIPENVMALFNDPQTIRVLATKSAKNEIHTVQLGSLRAPKPDMVICAAVIFKRSGENLESMKKRNEDPTVFVTDGRQSYEIRVKIKDFQTSGPMVDQMNEALKKAVGMTSRGIWIFEPVEVHNETPGPDAGKKIA